MEPFKAVADFQVKQWYYIDQDRQTLGPIPSKELVAKIQVGEVDGLSLIFGSGLDSWKPLGEIAELKAIIQKLAEEEDVAAIASDKSVDLTDQVYALESEDKTIDKDRYQKELAYMAELSRQKKEKEVASKENQRIYWDDAEQSWVEKEDDEIVPGEDSTLEQASKRRRTIDNDQNDFMQEDEEEEEEDGAELTVTSDQQSAAAKKKRKKRKNKKAQKNWVYITGLPADVTAEEINAHFSKVCYFALR